MFKLSNATQCHFPIFYSVWTKTPDGVDGEERVCVFEYMYTVDQRHCLAEANRLSQWNAVVVVVVWCALNECACVFFLYISIQIPTNTLKRTCLTWRCCRFVHFECETLFCFLCISFHFFLFILLINSLCHIVITIIICTREWNAVILVCTHDFFCFSFWKFLFSVFLASLLFWFGLCHIQSHCSIFICTQYISLFKIIAWLLLSMNFLHVFGCRMSVLPQLYAFISYTHLFNFLIYLTQITGFRDVHSQ